MTLTLLHTTEVHCARFDALRDEMAPGVALSHEVRERWLAEAQSGVSGDLAQEITSWVQGQGTPVLCTCTTIGAAAEAAGALRVDRPMMEAAARIGGPTWLAFCLESTWEVSHALLQEATGPDADIKPLPLTHHWPLFEAGDMAGFEHALARDVRKLNPAEGCVVLAQVSMAGAAALLQDLAVPVLSSAAEAMRAALEQQ